MDVLTKTSDKELIREAIDYLSRPSSMQLSVYGLTEYLGSIKRGIRSNLLLADVESLQKYLESSQRRAACMNANGVVLELKGIQCKYSL